MVDDNLDSIRERREGLELEAWKRRWYRFFIAVATVLTVAICAVAWIAYSASQRTDGSLPRSTGVEKSLDTPSLVVTANATVCVPTGSAS